jgi:hemerythrin-like domain-containing protein
MEPIGVLMREHRLIERMLRVIEIERNELKKSRKIDSNLLQAVIDFFRIYADKNHHGKEEDILFRALDKKKLNFDHRRLMFQLIEDHKTGRNIINGLDNVQKKFLANNAKACSEIVTLLSRLLTLYPKHIEIEDKHFFYPAMTYFTEEERNQMLDEFSDFDTTIDHEKYQRMVEEFERGEFEVIKNI